MPPRPSMTPAKRIFTSTSSGLLIALEQWKRNVRASLYTMTPWNGNPFIGGAIMKSRMLGLMLSIAAILLSAPPQTRAQQDKARPPNSVRLYVFDCGKLDIPDITPYQLT